MPRPRSDADSPWKAALDLYFREFLELLFPEAAAQIDWSRGYISLDSELQEISHGATLKRRSVDKLVQVWLANQEECWVLAHVEVQSRSSADFARRMYVYNYRIFDRYDRRVASFAVLADPSRTWRPQAFEYTLLGSYAGLRFATAKLRDYEARLQDLEASGNPFAVLVLAHLAAQRTRRSDEARLQGKLSLVKSLYSRGYTRERVLDLLRFVDWLVALSPNLEQRLRHDLERFEEEKGMPFVTSFERLSREEGIRQGVQQGLQQGMAQGTLSAAREAVLEALSARFGPVTADVSHRIHRVDDPIMLRSLLRQAVTASSLEAFLSDLPDAA